MYIVLQKSTEYLAVQEPQRSFHSEAALRKATLTLQVLERVSSTWMHTQLLHATFTRNFYDVYSSLSERVEVHERAQGIQRIERSF